MTKVQTPFEFFRKQAGWSYDPARETEDEGRDRGARLLAEAERHAREADWTFNWVQDDETDESFRKTDTPYYLWVCVARDRTGTVRASLSGVDFGPPPAEPWDSSYRRVVEAELALEGWPGG